MDACQLDINFSRTKVAIDSCNLPIEIPPESTNVSYFPVSLWSFGYVVSADKSTICHTEISSGQRLVDCVSYGFSGSEKVVNCRTFAYDSPDYYRVCQTYNIEPFDEIAECNNYLTNAPNRFQNCASPTCGNTDFLTECNAIRYEFAEHISDCESYQYSATEKWRDCITISFADAFVKTCVTAINGVTLQPPCVYKKVIIDKPEPDKKEWVCGTNRNPCDLHGNLLYQKQKHSTCDLPIDFACVRKQSIPILGGYIVLNESEITFEGNPVEFLSCDVQTDTSSWSWACSVVVPPDVFALLNLDNRKKDNPAIIDIKINGYDWRFMLDDYSDSRVFGKKTYTLKGRSLTAKLANGDVATKTKTYTTALNARQIIDAELDLTGFSIDNFNSVDWLVPANTYSYNEQTPMTVINDIAAAAGCYVESHRIDTKLSINKKLPVAIWQLNNATPDVIVPSSVIYSISGQRRINQLCNGVFVHGQANGVAVDATINGSDGNPRANPVIHALITDEAMARQTATQTLTATGRHKIETLTMPLSKKYSINLAELGQLWQLNETNNWLGQVIGIGISVKHGEVMQTVELDHYVGEGNV